MLVVVVAHRCHSQIGLMIVSFCQSNHSAFWNCESSSSGRSCSGQFHIRGLWALCPHQWGLTFQLCQTTKGKTNKLCIMGVLDNHGQKRTHALCWVFYYCCYYFEQSLWLLWETLLALMKKFRFIYADLHMCLLISYFPHIVNNIIHYDFFRIFSLIYPSFTLFGIYLPPHPI